MNSSVHKKDIPLILIADDDRSTRLSLRSLLQDDGYAIIEAENGEECLAAYRQHQPDMVLLDAVMPVMDGFTCCRLLSSIDREKLDRRSVSASIIQKIASTPILILAELEDSETVDRAFAAGAIDYIIKPIQSSVLSKRLFRILEAQSTQKALQESEEKYRFVVENLKEVIFQTNSAGTFSFLNPAWTDITGYTLEESLGRNFRQFIHPLDRYIHEEKWRSLHQHSETNCRYQIRYLNKNGDFGWIEIYAQIDANNCGSGLTISGTINEITESKRIEQYQKLEREVTLILAQSENFAVAKTKIIQAICSIIGWEIGEFWEVVRPGNKLRCLESWLNSERFVNFKEISQQINYLTGFGLPGRLLTVGRVWTSGKSIWFGNKDNNRALPKNLLTTKFGLQAAFGFPIATEKEKIGVTIFYSREHSQYDGDLVSLMETIGAQIGQFIQRKQAEEELQRQHLVLRLEIDRAAEYVRSLLPSPLKGSIAIEQKYIPSLQLGGDIFDYYWLDREHLVVYLLDVAGHGVSSALLSVSVFNFLRSQSFATIDPTQPENVLRELNRVFKINDDGDKFFTIWYGVYKVSDRQLTYASAGHAPAILRSGIGQNISMQKLFTKSFPIGMFSEAKYEQKTCQIEANSSLYVFSDGVFEIQKTDKEIWGFDAFVEEINENSLQKKNSLETLFERIQAINTKPTFDDDFSLLKLYFYE